MHHLDRDTQRHVSVITRNGMRREKFCSLGRSNHRIVLSVGTWTENNPSASSGPSGDQARNQVPQQYRRKQGLFPHSHHPSELNHLQRLVVVVSLILVVGV